MPSSYFLRFKPPENHIIHFRSLSEAWFTPQTHPPERESIEYTVRLESAGGNGLAAILAEVIDFSGPAELKSFHGLPEWETHFAFTRTGRGEISGGATGLTADAMFELLMPETPVKPGDRWEVPDFRPGFWRLVRYYELVTLKKREGDLAPLAVIHCHVRSEPGSEQQVDCQERFYFCCEKGQVLGLESEGMVSQGNYHRRFIFMKQTLGRAAGSFQIGQGEWQISEPSKNTQTG